MSVTRNNKREAVGEVVLNDEEDMEYEVVSTSELSQAAQDEMKLLNIQSGSPKSTDPMDLILNHYYAARKIDLKPTQYGKRFYVTLQSGRDSDSTFYVAMPYLLSDSEEKQAVFLKRFTDRGERELGFACIYRAKYPGQSGTVAKWSIEYITLKKRVKQMKK